MGEIEFFTDAKLFASELKKINGVIRVISNYDTDGITAASILVKALKREKKKFAVSIIKQLTKEILNSLKLEEYKDGSAIVFCDLGSGTLKDISEILADRKIFILDHHQVHETDFKCFHLNPLLYGLDGNKEVSAAGVTYFFARALNYENIDSSHIALIGAIGDAQENRGFIGLNNYIFQDALAYLEIKKGLRMFGAYTRPIDKVLEYSTDPYIPGVTGNSKGVYELLQQAGIKENKEGRFGRLSDFNNDDVKNLAAAIIVKRVNEPNAEDIFGDIYLLKNESKDSITKDLREFSTIINACGRLNKSAVGIGLCLGSEEMKEKALEILMSYKREIVNIFNWFYENRGKRIIEEDKFVIINAEGFVRDSLIGTLCSMISKSGVYKDNTIILGMAYTIDGSVKVSIRIAGFKTNKINLKFILGEICKRVGNCEAGGHDSAAGTLVPQEKEEEFLETSKEYLRNFLIEELVD